MTLPSLLLGLALALPAPAPRAARPAAPVKVRVSIAHVAPDRWRVEWAFARPVSGLVFDPPVAGWRAEAWRPVTPGVRLDTLDGNETLVAERAVGRMSVEVGRFGRFDHGRYVPMIPFTDGGAALFLRYLAGRPLVGDSTVDADLDFAYAGLRGERVLEPAAEMLDAYVYFGPARPVATPYARFVVDPGAPAWLRDELARVIVETDRVYAERLRGGRIGTPPLVLVGVGDIDSTPGASLKGDATPGQFGVLLTGRGLREESARKREVVARLVAHELAHVWQYRDLPGGFNPDEPWLHEGAAEAMAVEALALAGLWDSTQVSAYAATAGERCRTALDGTTLAEAARAGSAEAIYACGFGMWWRAGAAGPLAAWARLARAVARDEGAFTQATLARVAPGS